MSEMETLVRQAAGEWLKARGKQEAFLSEKEVLDILSQKKSYETDVQTARSDLIRKMKTIAKSKPKDEQKFRLVIGRETHSVTYLFISGDMDDFVEEKIDIQVDA